MGETHYLLAANLGFHHKAVARDQHKALESFQAAAAAEPTDLYLKREIANALAATASREQVIAYLESEMEAVLAGPLIAYSLLDAYLRENRYADFDALCARVDFSPNWQIPGPHSLWTKRHFQEALQLLARGDLRPALDLLTNLSTPPPHLGIAVPDAEDDRRYYHMGCIHEKLGDMHRAGECWEQSVAVEHFTGYEKAYWNNQWTRRYYQALSLQKLGRLTEAEAYFDAMELLSKVPDLPLGARQEILGLVERGRFAPDDQKDPAGFVPLTVQTAAEA
jgi:tetratricopeptide (TPR) repeat protein